MDIFLPIYLPFTNPSASPMRPNFTASFGLDRLRLCVYSSPFLCLSKKTLKAMPLRSFHKTPCGNRQSVDSNGVRSAYSLTIVKGYLVDFHLANTKKKIDQKVLWATLGQMDSCFRQSAKPSFSSLSKRITKLRSYTHRRACYLDKRQKSPNTPVRPHPDGHRTRSAEVAQRIHR